MKFRLNRPLKITVADSKTKETMAAQVETDPLAASLVSKKLILASIVLTLATKITSRLQDWQNLVI
jgi:hypothetical protein